ncbi:Calpain-A [Papilio machaon]|uniref:Calpain-A n=2 Tax=Papilionoidea TaxID=37572 RepID=A0A194RJM9_PAPMA|nr:Calpain-A [Papilio machaon]
MMEIKEDIVKLRKEEVRNLTTTFHSSTVTNAAATWKGKSVSIVSPKTGHISRQKEVKTNSSGFFSKLIKDFKKTKVSDFEYQQSKVRQNSSYKPFWATKVKEQSIEDLAIKKKADVAERSNSVYNKGFVFRKETDGSPTVILGNDVKNVQSPKRHSIVEYSKEYNFKPLPNDRGSKMFMPTGERLYWLGETRPSSFGPATYQDFKDIRSRCLAEGRLFEDPEFPPIDRSLYYKERLDRPITWLRPSEICEDPQLFVEGYSRFDVRQGELGDCWLLAAVANLTLHRKLFFQVVPDDQSFDEDYAGVFHFRFWQYGRWVDVVIDDRLPTYRGKLVFLHSSERNEFWSALLEKAYAKLHGSYEALKGGSTCEAMEDFTGGVTEMYDVAELPPNFYTILLKAYERNSLMGCSIEPDPNILEAETPAGLIRGHAYSVTRVKYVDIETPGRAGKIPLLRLRNPWGNEAEWNGPWSDKSPEWRFIPESEKEELGLTFDDDGEFWMSFKDFPDPNILEAETPAGLIRGHAYSVTRVKYVDIETPGRAGKIPLLRLRNPWGNEAEWNGPWSDKSPEWRFIPESEKEELGLTFDDDGEFWMSFKDFVNHFSRWQTSKRPHEIAEMAKQPLPIDIHNCRCVAYPQSTKEETQKREYLTFLCNSCSIKSNSPSHPFLIRKGIIVALMQKNRRSQRHQGLECLTIGFAVYRLPDYGHVPKPLDVNFFKYNASVGRSQAFINLREVKEIAPNPEPTDPVRDFFNRLAGDDGEVDWQELKEILDYAMREELTMRHGAYDGGGVPGPPGQSPNEQGCLEQLLCALCTPICKEFGVDLQQIQQQSQEQVHLNQPQPQPELKGQGFSKEVCRSMIAMLDKDNSGGLGFDEFKTLWIDLRNWRAVFRLYDTEGRGAIPAQNLRDALHSAGYTVNAHVLNALAHRYGSSDGYIQFDDFIMCSVRLKTMIDTFKGRSSGGEYATFSLEEWLNRTVYS